MDSEVTGTTDSQVRAKVWVTPGQVASLRNASSRASASYLEARNDALLALLYDTGLRVGELVQLDVANLRDELTAVYLPTAIQKDFPNENSPPPATLALGNDTTQSLAEYLAGGWHEGPALFPSRSSSRISTQGVRDVVTKAAIEAGVRPYTIDGSRGEPADVTPQALRHGVAYRMLKPEGIHSLHDVRNRLRHKTVQTTERIYGHFISA